MEITIVVILILINGLLSMAEISLISARKTSLKNDAKNGSKAADLAVRLANEPDRFLPTSQIGITLTAILMGVYSSDIASPTLLQLGMRLGLSAEHALLFSDVLIVACVTYFAIIFGELVPKRLGMIIAERIAKASAIPMNLLSKIAAPIVWFLAKSTSLVIKILGVKHGSNKVTEEEIKSLIHEGTVGGDVQKVEQDIVERVFSLGDTKVSSIMSYRSSIVWLDSNWSNDQLYNAVVHDLCDLYPVAKGSLDDMIGVVYLKDLFGKLGSSDFNIEQLVRPAQYFHENMNVYRALEIMKENHVEYGLIWDEYGSCQGIITLKDLFEALVGIIPNEHEQSNMIKENGNGWLVSGQCSFFDFLSFFDVTDIPLQQDHNTVGGLVFNQLDHMPHVGERIRWMTFEIEIVEMDGPRIDKMMVRRTND